MEFEKGLQQLINQHSMENSSNTPDFILAHFLITCLVAYDAATVRRERWYGRKGGPLTEIPIPEPETVPEAHRRAQRVAETLRADRNRGERKLEEAQKEAEHLKFRLDNLRENTKRDNDALYRINEQLRAEVKAARDAGFRGEPSDVALQTAPVRAMVVADQVGETGGWLVTLSCGHKVASKHQRVQYHCFECSDDPPGFGEALRRLDAKVHANLGVPSLAKLAQETVDKLEGELKMVREELALEQKGRMSEFERAGRLAKEHMRYREQIDEALGIHPLERRAGFDGALQLLLFRYEKTKVARDEAVESEKTYREFVEQIYVRHLLEFAESLTVEQSSPPEMVGGVDHEHVMKIMVKLASASLQERQSAGPQQTGEAEPGGPREVDRAFYGLTVHQRDKAWLEVERLTQEVNRLELKLADTQDARDNLSSEVTAVINTLPQDILVQVREGNGPAFVGATLAVSVSKLLEERSKLKTYIIGLEKDAEMSTPRGTVGFVAPDYVQKMIHKACKETWHEAIDSAAQAVCNYVDGRCNSGRCPCSKVRALTLPEAMES